MRSHAWSIVCAGALISVVSGVPFRPDAVQAQPPDADDVSGTVTDSSTGRPVAGAMVSVWRRDRPLSEDKEFLDLDWPDRPVRSVRTDAKGGFVFPAEPRAALRWVTVAAPGYAPGVAEWWDGAPPASVALEPAQVRKLRVVRPAPAGWTAAAGAELFLPGGDTPIPAARFVAAADGSVSAPIEPLRHVLVRGPGITTGYVVADDGVELKADAGGPVTGTVTRPDGTPVAGAVVRVIEATATQGVSDASGKFRLDGIRCSDELLRLTAVAPGLVAAPVEVKGGDSAVSLVVAPPARVTGRVLGPTGKPVAGAQVAALRPELEEPEGGDAPEYMSQPTGPDGTFSIDGLPHGPVALVSVAEGDLETVAPFVVPAPKGAPGADLRLGSSKTRLPVRVIDESGRPVAGARVAGLGIEGDGRTGADGTALAPVRKADWSGGCLLEVTPPGAGGFAAGVLVPIETVRAGRVEIVLARAATLRMRAVDADEKTVPDDDMVLTAPGLRPGDPVIALPGAGMEPGLPAPRIAPRSAPYRFVVERRSVPGVWAGALSEKDAGAQVRVLDVRFERVPGCTASGRLVPAGDGRRVRAAGFPEDIGPFTGLRNVIGGDVAGNRIEFADLLPGDWWLVAHQGSHPEELLVARRVRVEAGRASLDLGDLTPRLVTVRGVVRSGGAPVPGARVLLRSVPYVGARADSSPDGEWLLRVPAGFSGTLEAERPGWGAFRREFRADADSVIEVDIPRTGVLLVSRGRDKVGAPLPVQVRSGAAEVRVQISAATGCGVVRTATPGPVEIVVGTGAQARTVRSEVVPGRTTIADLGGE